MTYFGTDGIRGHAYDTLPLLRAYQLGYAISKVFQDHTCIIGCDTRVSSASYVKALLEGLNETKSMYLGVVPTPVLAYESMYKKTIGVMITASHNPFSDNGLKVFLHGLKLSEALLITLESYMEEIQSFEPQLKTLPHISAHHYEQMYPSFDLKTPDIPYVIDAANGAASFILSKYLQGMIIHHKPDGYNINLNCGATHLESILEATKDIPLGFSLDGDADRLLMVLDQKVIYGDQILYLLMKDQKLQGKILNVALSIMTNPGVIKAFETLDVKVYQTPVGDKYLLEAIHENKASYGAEASGHIITPYIPIGDGILMTKLILDMISRHGLDTIRRWLEDITLWPMETKNLKVSKAVLDYPHIKTLISTLKQDLKPYEVFIVRPSGTEDLIRITVSKENEAMLLKTMHTLLEAIKESI